MDDNRNERRRQWWQRNAGKYQKKPSMTRRKGGHDYYGHHVYMITVVVAGRRNVLGTLCPPDASHQEPWVNATPLGEAVKRYWHDIPSHHPHVRLFRSQLMPDHFHGILHVTKKTEVHLSDIVKAFKQMSNRTAREMEIATPLWESNYNDLILSSHDQLSHMMNYVHDNPRRLWVKRSHSELFKARKTVDAAGHQVEALGNLFLLDFPLIAAVQCSRKLTEEQIQERVEHFMALAQRGVVLVSPAISPGEKKVMQTAQEAHCKVIKIVDNGFTPLSKPSREDFDACGRGDLLLISPFKRGAHRADMLPPQQPRRRHRHHRMTSLHAMTLALAFLPFALAARY